MAEIAEQFLPLRHGSPKGQRGYEEEIPFPLQLKSQPGIDTLGRTGRKLQVPTPPEFLFLFPRDEKTSGPTHDAHQLYRSNNQSQMNTLKQRRALIQLSTLHDGPGIRERKLSRGHRSRNPTRGRRRDPGSPQHRFRFESHPPSLLFDIQVVGRTVPATSLPHYRFQREVHE